MGVSSVHPTSASPEQSGWKAPFCPFPDHSRALEKTVGKGLLRGQQGLAPLSAFPHFSEHRKSQN